MYKLKDAKAVRQELLTMFPSTIVISVSATPYRPKLAESDNRSLGSMMRQLHPEQYTFIFHLLHLMSQIEKEVEGEAEATPEAEAKPEETKPEVKPEVKPVHPEAVHPETVQPETVQPEVKPVQPEAAEAVAPKRSTRKKRN